MDARCMVPPKTSSEAVTLMLLGSGVRFINALAAIKEKGLKVKRIVGASAGSIIGSIYATGMPLPEMKKIAMEIDTLMFRDFSFVSIMKGKGLCSGNTLERLVDTWLGGRKFSDNFRSPPS